MLTGGQLNTALSFLPVVPAVGIASRAVKLKYSNCVLSSIGSLKFGGRYNSENAFEVLYLADSLVTALLEVKAMVPVGTQLITIHGPPRAMFSIHYRLSAVFDLTVTSNQCVLGTNLQELTGAWIPFSAQGQISPTQELGATAHGLMNIEALKVPSAQNSQDPHAYNLAVFPDRLLPNSYLEIYDESDTLRERLP